MTLQKEVPVDLRIACTVSLKVAKWLALGPEAVTLAGVVGLAVGGRKLSKLNP